ncbi:MAG: hypothetical protein CMO55_11330 [Verrucomicrobiales bacterium]|nr:hypothetical protein [Verrucomicrobiales bacterium]
MKIRDSALLLLALLPVHADYASCDEEVFPGVVCNNAVGDASRSGAFWLWRSLELPFDLGDGKGFDLVWHFGTDGYFGSESCLGYNSFFPLFDSNVVLLDEARARVHLPDGSVIYIYPEDIDAGVWKSRNFAWKANVDGDSIVLCRDNVCLHYTQGRLRKIESGDEAINWEFTRDGVELVSSVRGCLLKAKFADSDGAALMRELEVSSGPWAGEVVEFSYSDRPVFAEVNGHPIISELVSSLSLIGDSSGNIVQLEISQSEDGTEQLRCINEWAHGNNSEQVWHWDLASGKLLKDGLSVYKDAHLTADPDSEGIERIFADGSMQAYYWNRDTCLLTEAHRDGTLTQKVFVGTVGKSYMKMRSFEETMLVGERSEMRRKIRYYYDTEGNVLRKVQQD